MTEPEILDPVRNDTPSAHVLAGLVRLTHIIYALHSLALLLGIVGSASIVGSFLGTLPSLAAVVLNYIKRGDVRGTWLESHFRWQIRTFWFALLWFVLALLIAATFIGIPLALLMMGLTGLWIVYRIVRGWLALNERRALATV